MTKLKEIARFIILLTLTAAIVYVVMEVNDKCAEGNDTSCNLLSR